MTIWSRWMLAMVIMMMLKCSWCLYCSSTCIGTYSGCNGTIPDSTCTICSNKDQNSCFLCAQSIYNQIAKVGTSQPCQLLPQTQLIAQQLLTYNMSLSGYKSSRIATIICSGYNLSGRYGVADYLQKTFTGIPDNHYEVIIRYSVALIGGWPRTNYIREQFSTTDNLVNISNQYVVGCNAETEDLCAFGTTDCIIVHENTILHNSTDLSIRLSANAVLTSGQFWGVKDLLIAVKLCFPYCATCYSPLVSQCFSCKTGYYLLGNYCLEKCTTGMYQLNVSNACVSVCPSRYYADSVASSCLDCSVGCLICSSASSCLSYDTGYGQENSTWKNNLPFWILVIVLAAILLAILTGCLVYRCKNGFFPVFQNKKGKKGEEDEGRQMAFKHKISNVSMQRQQEFNDIEHNRSREIWSGVGVKDAPIQLMVEDVSLDVKQIKKSEEMKKKGKEKKKKNKNRFRIEGEPDLSLY